MTELRRLLRLKEVERAVGFKRTKIAELEAAGKFPKRVPLQPRGHAWVEDEIAEFNSRQIAQRDQPPA